MAQEKPTSNNGPTRPKKLRKSTPSVRLGRMGEAQRKELRDARSAVEEKLVTGGNSEETTEMLNERIRAIEKIRMDLLIEKAGNDIQDVLDRLADR